MVLEKIADMRWKRGRCTTLTDQRVCQTVVVSEMRITDQLYVQNIVRPKRFGYKPISGNTKSDSKRSLSRLMLGDSKLPQASKTQPLDLKKLKEKIWI